MASPQQLTRCLVVALCLLVRQSASQISTSRLSPQHPTALVGGNITMSCASANVVSGGGVPTISWRRNNVPLASDPRRAATSIGSSINTAQSQLTITNVRASDRGWYTCFGQTTVAFRAVDYSLDVQEPLQILSTQVNWLQVITNTDVILPCVVTGYPKPTIAWYKDGTRVVASSSISIDAALGWLTIKNVSTASEGNYTCRADQSALLQAMQQQHNIEVTVVAAVSGASTPTGLNTTVRTAEIGDTVTLPVSMFVAAIPVTYSWERNGVALQSLTLHTGALATADISFDLKINSVADTGLYTVTVDNNTALVTAIDVVSTAAPRPFNIANMYVIAPLNTSASSRQAVVGCRAVGRPVPTLSLMVGGRIISTSSTGVVLATSTLQYGAAGTYACAAGARTAVVRITTISECNLHNHIANPTGASPPTSGWNVTSPASQATDSQTGNAFFTATSKPGSPNGKISRYIRVPIGLAIVSYSFRMRLPNPSASPGAMATATLDFLQRGTAELPVVDISLQQRKLTSNSSSWAWYQANITVPDGSLLRGVRLTLYTVLARGATEPATANFDSFCIQFFLYGTARPVFVAQLQSEYTGYIGYPVSFDCTAEGSPSPQYSWVGNGFTLPYSQAIYTFVPLTSVAAGTYMCTATVSDGSLIGLIVQSTTLRVLPVVAPVVVPSTNGTDGVKYQEVNLTCPISGAPVSYTWFKSGGLVPTAPRRVAWTPSSNVLSLYNTDLSDAGQYECRANNTLGTKNAFVNLVVYSAPEVMSGRMTNNRQRIARETRLTLICPLVGDPTPTITWTVDGQDAGQLKSIDAVVNTSSRSLNFHFVMSFPDPINITCSAMNVYGAGPVVSFLLGSTVVVATTTAAPTTSVDFKWWEVLGPFNLLARWIWICILGGVLILLIILICCCVRCCQNRKKRSLTPSRNALRNSTSRPSRTSDTIRTNAAYNKAAEDVSFVAINAGTTNPGFQSANQPYSSMVPGAGVTAPPPSYNHAISNPGPPPVPNMASHPSLSAVGGGAPPPLPNMENHPARRRERDSIIHAQKCAEEDDEEGFEGEDYLIPDNDPNDTMAQRAPMPMPALVDGAPEVSPLEPLMQQQYMNVDQRPPAPIPGPEDYENMG